jgi:hypothetical protein
MPYPKNPSEMSLAEANEPIVRTGEIMVNCRLVKDYSYVIQFKATCHHPQILLSATEFTFHGSIRRKDVQNDDSSWVVDFDQTSDVLEITNILADDLHYVIMNESQYFQFQFLRTPSIVENGTIILTRSSSHQIQILPKMDTIFKNAENLRKEKYLLEHIVVYNKQRPREKHWISLKLSFGHLLHFQVILFIHILNFSMRLDLTCHLIVLNFLFVTF